MDIRVQLIRQYIYDMKNVWVQIAEPDTPERWALFNRALLIAWTHYASR